MAKRGALIFILSLLVLLATSLWLYTTRIVSSLLPPLLNNETLQIDTLQISSIGWRQTSIARISGHTEIDSGWIDFDIREASINYNLSRLQPELVKIKNADVDITLIAKTTHHLFQPLLYQVATGILSEGEIAP